MHSNNEPDYIFCDAEHLTLNASSENLASEAQSANLLFTAPKLPEKLRDEIHAIATKIENQADEAEEVADESILETLGLTVVTAMAKDAFNYLARKYEELNDVDPMAEAKAAIAALAAATCDNAVEEEVNLEHLETKAAELSKQVAEFADEIKKATAARQAASKSTPKLNA